SSLSGATADSNFFQIAGTGQSGSADIAAGSVAVASKLNSPSGSSVDSGGNLVLADSGHGEIEVEAQSDSNPGFSIGNSSAWSAGNLYPIAGTGNQSPSVSGQNGLSIRLSGPSSVSLDAHGNVLVADTGDSEVDLLAESASNPGYAIGSAWTQGD